MPELNVAAGAEGLKQKPSDLESLLLRQKQLEEDLRGVERQIYELEEHYIERTHVYGNVIRSFVSNRSFVTFCLREKSHVKLIPKNINLFGLL